MDKQREEFIKEFKNCGFDFSIDMVPMGGIIQVEYVFSNQYTEGFYQGWKQAQKVAVPEGFVLVPRILNEELAFNMAISRIIKPPKSKDPIVNEIQLQAYTDNLYVCQESLITDYKAMIEAQEQANEPR